jgi:FtsZ-interacting cell division protein ZipA
MSTTAWIILVVVVVLVAAILIGIWQRRRDMEERRTVATAHRENAQMSEDRAAEAQARADRLAADAERERAAAGASRQQAQEIDPDRAQDAPAGREPDGA